MPGLRDKMDMFCVAVYEREHHTNPDCTVYVRESDRMAAIVSAMSVCRAHMMTSFVKVTVTEAVWKQEEEFCTPWQKVELP